MSQYAQPNRDRRLLYGAAAALLVVVIVLATVLLTRGGDDPKTTTPKESTTSTPSPRASSSCGLPDGSAAMPTTGPQAEWVLVAGTAAPRSKEFGPARATGGIHSCFARNPLGALFAAANFEVDAAAKTLSPAEVIRRRSVPGINTQRTIAVLKRRSQGGEGGRGAQLVGFRVDQYSSRSATVELAWRVMEGPSTGALFAARMDLAWESGDWFIVTPALDAEVTTDLRSLQGFVRWSGSSS